VASETELAVGIVTMWALHMIYLVVRLAAYLMVQAILRAGPRRHETERRYERRKLRTREDWGDRMSRSRYSSSNRCSTTGDAKSSQVKGKMPVGTDEARGRQTERVPGRCRKFEADIQEEIEFALIQMKSRDAQPRSTTRCRDIDRAITVTCFECGREIARSGLRGAAVCRSV